MLNRARLFIHRLQCDNTLDWDDKLGSNRTREWKNICVQLNKVDSIKIDRFIGERSKEYEVVAFTDSSKTLYGTVLYIRECGNEELKILFAKTKVINKQLSAKGVPSLELHAVLLGVECLIDLFSNLSLKSDLVPINIVNLILYTDSMVTLNWLKSYHINLESRVAKQYIFVYNRYLVSEKSYSSAKTTTPN